MKTTRIFLRVSPHERDSIRQRAAQAGKSVSEYLRQASCNLFIHAPISPEITRAISGWSRNLNQIAYKANSSGEVEVAAVRELRQEAIKILSALEVKR